MFVIVVGLLLWVGAADADPGEVAAIRDARATLEMRPHAEDEVWRNIRAGGLPLVEDHPEDVDLRRVTFAIQAPQSVEAIRLDSVINAGEARQPVENYLTDFTLDMHRLAGTRIYYRTVDVPRDVSAAYSFLGLADQGWRRLTDRHNLVHLRGGAAEAVLMAEPRYRHPAIVPMPAAERVDARPMALESEVLGRSVFLERYALGGAGENDPVLIIYDRFLWGVRAPASEIVQRLQNAGDLPPMHVVLIDQLDPASADQAYADQILFLSRELPDFLAEFGMAGPRILAGASRRGMVASIAALSAPDEVLAVISLSGSFYWAPRDELPRWPERQVGPAPEDAPRFILAAGSLETVETSTNQGHIMLDTNRSMTTALADAGYRAELLIYPGGHDIAGWRQALAVSLERLFAED